jgi:hypothetical protein
MLYDQFGDLKFKYRNREFWCRGYYVDTVGKTRQRYKIRSSINLSMISSVINYPFHILETRLRVASNRNADARRTCAC